ncbi:MAG: ABC transporter ATP-binding protein [Candidatus Hodarchaeales archaeon]|jgi:tungstate transport system ATP-binding protein
MKPLIELRNLTVYGMNAEEQPKTIIQNVNLPIHSGEIIGVVGPSGAGKTTLVKAISLLNTHSIKGEYFYQEKQVIPNSNGKSLGEIRKNLIFIHQHPVLFKGTVRYNIEYALKLRNIKEREYLKELISLFKLDDIVERNISLLSGGEKQRISLLRAMVVKPRVLVLDEPTQNLDPENISNIEKNIDHFRANEKGTVIIVTHNLFQARRITDKILFLMNGQIVEYGKTDDLFSKPERRETADFLTGDTIF